MWLEFRVKEFIKNNPKIVKKQNKYVWGKSKTLTKIPKDTILLLRTIGIIHGDGNMSNERILISEKEFDFQIRLHNYFKKLFGMEFNIYQDKNRNTFYLHSKNKVVYNFLNQVLEIPKGSIRKNIKIPSYFENLNQNEINSYVEGLFDAEGSVKIKQAELNFCSNSKILFDFVKEILNKNEIIFSPYSKKREERKNIEYNIYGKNNLKNFQSRIGFSHPTKIKKLTKHIS